MGCGSGGSNLNQINNVIRPGARKVFCVKFQKELEGLEDIPFEGHPLGQKIFSEGKQELNLTLEAGRSATFRYRILILGGTAKPDAVEREYRAFTQGS